MRNSIANALELRLSCSNPSIWTQASFRILSETKVLGSCAGLCGIYCFLRSKNVQLDYMMTSSNGNISALLAICRGNPHWSTVDSPRKGQWRGALVFPWICTGRNGWASNRDAGDLRRIWRHCNDSVYRKIMFFQIEAYPCLLSSFRARHWQFPVRKLYANMPVFIHTAHYDRIF